MSPGTNQITCEPYGRYRDPPYEVEIHYPPYGDPYSHFQTPAAFAFSGPGGGKFSFSQREIRELFISIGVLTLAFALVLGGWGDFIAFLGPSFIAAFTGFFLHELGHKFVAQSYGMFSEFRMSAQGLMLALFTSFVGFLIAAPGAVVISGYPTREQSGKIAIAGPGMNVVIALIFLPLLWVDSEMIQFTATIVVFINALLALFNMIPYHPLDGSKIVKWSIPHYIALLVIALPLFIYSLF